MITFLDTSALVKVVLGEPGAETVQERFAASASVIASALIYPEARAAVARARREGRITESQRVEAVAEVERLAEDMILFEPDRPLLWRAGDVAEQHALRGFDAVHLTSAVEYAPHAVFVCADVRLTGAAREAGLPVLAVAA